MRRCVMADRTNGDAVDIIENEGLEYAVRHYISGTEFKDSMTRKLWIDAELALDRLVNYLQRETGREIS